MYGLHCASMSKGQLGFIVQQKPTNTEHSGLVKLGVDAVGFDFPKGFCKAYHNKLAGAI